MTPQISEHAFDRLAAMFRGPDVAGTRYELISTLGRGGMGIVYLARDRALDREVALKIVDRPSDDGGAAQQLAGEARILARLEHPGIVPVHDFGELPDGRLFYAMKRIRGERLDRWAAIATDRTTRLGVFLRICDAVAFAHAHNVVHRDLKPENVMVAEFGEVLVLDWGIATLRQDPLSDDGIDRPGIPIEHQSIAGTPEYMAPEQARGDRDVDHRADIYALGAILQTIAGEAPALAAISRKARSHDPVDRYQSAVGLAADVSRFVAGEAVGAHRERLGDRLVRLGRRYRLPLLLVSAYLLMRILLIWLVHV